MLDPSGIAICICTAANPQTRPAVAFGGSYYLVTWDDSRGTSNDIYGARVSRAGLV